MSPTRKSVDAIKARMMLDLCSLSRDFTLTAIITNVFRTTMARKERETRRKPLRQQEIYELPTGV